MMMQVEYTFISFWKILCWQECTFKIARRNKDVMYYQGIKVSIIISLDGVHIYGIVKAHMW